jgi:hypothetical protein
MASYRDGFTLTSKRELQQLLEIYDIIFTDNEFNILHYVIIILLIILLKLKYDCGSYYTRMSI